MGRILSMSFAYCFSISIANACHAPELARSFSAGVSGTPNCTRENKSSSCFRSKSEYSAQRSSSSKNRRLNLSLSMRLFILTDSPLFAKNLPRITVRKLTSRKKSLLGWAYHLRPFLSVHGMFPFTNSRIDDRRCLPSTEVRL